MGDGRPTALLKAAAAPPAAKSAAVSADMDVEAAGVVRADAAPSLNILHILRAPLGGLFRHVVDLVAGQAGARPSRRDDRRIRPPAERAPTRLWPSLRRIWRSACSASPLAANSVRPMSARCALSRGWIKNAAPDVLHGHGAKGAALARLTPSAPNAIRVYTPHGGSLVYRPGTLGGGFYRTLEWLLKWRTDLFLFESSYIAGLFRTEIGRPPGIVRVVHNGVGDAEFAPIVPRPDATDIICLGELRPVKAFDVLIEALAILKSSGRRVSATIAGEGPDEAELKALAEQFGVADLVRFVGYRPAREAFAMGRMMVIPSRAESLPYVILEAAAAGVPIVSTRVGGIPEIFGPQSDHLIAPDDIGVLVGAIGAALDAPGELKRIAQSVKSRVQAEFSLPAMVDGGLAAYREAIALRKLAQFA